MLTKRTNILFDPQTWSLLQQVSSQNKISIGEIVRRSVKEKYLKPNQALARTNLLESIAKNGKKINTKNINYKALISYDRKH